MTKLSASQQKLLKGFHMIFAGLWLSCVIVLGLLPIISAQITNGDEIYMYNLAYHFIDMLILTPAAILTFLTGLVYSIFTAWGFARHGWILYKWIVTLLIIVVGTVYLGPMVTDLLAISDAKRAAALQDPYYHRGHTIGLYAAIINSALLISAVFFSIYKPWKNLKK
ncbi:conserved hypothetical protein [Chloroherpeton thalassium ATCC 35110]|uniref:DUF2269 domain-containing protein n=1 Tax=Chloroherpeton thalassium (strain ATCC 35110 / GB-78) TaxID=517418 RepID=B3QY83_CHLT3|nr:hypothetical protein [Chloroherpeton thalassium]ACF15049.1 conserved hypothetical protein [Chloroherpeton thalassium ATCC 35110]